jgi:Predicted metal-dependent membrane protease
LHRKYFYPKISQSFLLLIICLGLQAVTGIIVGIYYMLKPDAMSKMTTLLLILSPVCTFLTAAFGAYRSKKPLKDYFHGWPDNKNILIYCLLFFIGVYFASSILAGILGNFIPSDESVNGAITEGFNNFFGVFAIVVLAPVFEETLFRGIILRGFLKNYGAAKSIIVSAVLFGILHLNPLQSINAAILGIALGWLFLKTGSLWVCIFFHSLNNGLSTVLYHVSTKYNISDAQILFIAVPAIIAGIAAFVLLKRQPDELWEITKEKEDGLWKMQMDEAVQAEVSANLEMFEVPQAKKHSGPGIASFVLSIFVWLGGAISYIAVILISVLSSRVSRSAVLLYWAMLISSPVIALIGLALGITGAVNKDRKKVFSVLGIVFNSITLLISVLFIIFVILISKTFHTLPLGGGIQM